MVIAVKYCGGCNSSYDRGAMVGRIRCEFPEATIVNADDQDGSDLVLVVCGCSSVCAAHSHLDGRHGKIITACENDFAAVDRFLREAGYTPSSHGGDHDGTDPVQ